MLDESTRPFVGLQVGRLPPAVRGALGRFAARARRIRLRALLFLRGVGPFIRRVIDVVVAGGALVALAPLLIAAAAAVKLTSPGSIFFRQERVGIAGQRFMMFKFRTMVVGADAAKKVLQASVEGALDGVRFKIKKDPRITPIGRVLRRFSVDELPQLWNVVIGDMTLIGPRPPVPREVELYGPRELRRLEVRPGLTCLWQISGRSDLSFEQQVELDIHYIDRARLVDELVIVLRTIPAVLSGRGAY